MREPLAIIPMTVVDRDATAEDWQAAKDELCRYTAEGKALIRQDGMILDIGHLANLGSVAELDGCELLCFDPGVLAQWQKTHGPG